MIFDFSIFLQKKQWFFRFQPVFGSVNKLVPVNFFSNGYPSILVLDSTLYDPWWIFGSSYQLADFSDFFVCAKLPRERVPKIPQFFLKDNMLNINFDVTMLDMSCDHVTVGVWDASLGGFLANKNRTTEGWILRIDRHTHTWLLTTDFLAKTRVVAN